jgi:hypothetical protein
VIGTAPRPHRRWLLSQPWAISPARRATSKVCTRLAGRWPGWGRSPCPPPRQVAGPTARLTAYSLGCSIRASGCPVTGQSLPTTGSAVIERQCLCRESAADTGRHSGPQTNARLAAFVRWHRPPPCISANRIGNYRAIRLPDDWLPAKQPLGIAGMAMFDFGEF